MFVILMGVPDYHGCPRLPRVIETAKANGIGPYEYLNHVFKELPKARTLDHVEALLPWNLDGESLKR